MIRRFFRSLSFLLVVAVAVGIMPQYSYGAPAKKKTTKTTTSSNKKGSTKKKNSTKKTSSNSAKKETSSDVKKKEAAARKEIKDTQQKIAVNEKEIAANVSLLNELELGIKASEGKIADLSSQLKAIDTEINVLSGKIADNEKRIQELRTSYIDAVKKMRKARKQTSLAAFIFSSKNFYQAYRRMRYLKEFAQWRTRRVASINSEIQKLNKSKQELADMRVTKDATLEQQRKAQMQLSEQQADRRATVAKLKADGEALQKYLARKQSEANQLQSRMTELIAAEQAAAAEAQRRREEQARIEKERKEREAREAEERRLAEEKRLKEQKAQEEARKKELAQQNTKKEQSSGEKKENSGKADKKETSKPDKKEKSYAEARGAAPLNNPTTPPVSNTPKSTPAPAVAGGSFEKMKGSLPRPVSGSFSVVNAFGKHPLPDLPDVMYDNPGIDALVKKGEHAKAVYEGTVSGVYMINGFGNVVLVNHGDYFTVYGNLSSPTVKKGQVVKQGQDLGAIATDPDDDNRSTIHFEVWKGRTKLNPSEWIR